MCHGVMYEVRLLNLNKKLAGANIRTRGFEQLKEITDFLLPWADTETSQTKRAIDCVMSGLICF